MIDWELGSVDYWVAFDRGKPFPITFYRKNGTWTHDIHTTATLTTEQQTLIQGFIKERESDLKYIWKSNMTTRLNWNINDHIH